MHVGAIEHDIVVQLAEAVIDMMKMVLYACEAACEEKWP